MRAEAVLEGLNDRQREAALATRGPVAILAGAGTGKTTTITHRIAYQVASGAFTARQVLAVTFTEKAAGELRGRLAALGVGGVEARTFHAAALSQLGRWWTEHAGTPLGEILDAKAPLIASLANALPPPHRFVPRRDLATEIEWAKNRMVDPDGYLEEVADTGHAPPIPAELMQRVFRDYERRKQRTGRLDFEDMLSLAVRMFDDHPAAAGAVRERYAAFTVDEFQDVNPLQAALLDRWLGGRDELCVVGDDYQTIYGFTGASATYLLRFRERYPVAKVIRLEENYRSTPEILATANRLTPRLGGFEKVLRATVPAGSPPVIRAVAGEGGEVRFVVEEAVRLHRSEGVAHEEMAVLYRINARSEPYEEAFAAAGVPYQVRDGAFLRRPGPRAAVHRLRREAGPVAMAVDRVTGALGFEPGGGPDAGPEEVTRQADLARLRALAREFEAAQPLGDLAAFLEELSRRFSTETSGRGINLMTYHRAKGLEFDAVFLPRLLDGELPFRSGRNRAPVEEERRLLYVGITRARKWLYITWPVMTDETRSGRSPFIEELSPSALSAPGPHARSGRETAASPKAASPVAGADEPVFDALKRWRRDRASRDGVPAYVVFHDATLAEIARRRPRSLAELLTVGGVGPTKLDRYGPDVLAILSVPQP